MQTIVLESPHSLVPRNAQEPAPPGPGEVTVRILRVGICGTDLHAYAGRQPFMRYPLIPGHELAVEIVAIGADGAANASPSAPARPAAGDVRLEIGDRCTVVPYLSDGTCHACRRGHANCCASLEVLGVHRDGGLCERMNLPADTLVPANDVNVDALAVVEMLAVGAHAVGRAGIEPDDDVLVIGAGPIGLGVAAFARLRARRIAIVEARADRLTFLRDLRLAEPIQGGDLERTSAAVRHAFDGDLPTVVLDATGNAASMEGCPDLTARAGRIVFVGHTKERLGFENPVLHGRELTLATSRNATRADFETVLSALRAGNVDPLPWITHRVGPTQLAEQLPVWARGEGGVVKALAVMA